MGLDQPDARRGGGKKQREQGSLFFSSDGTAAVGNELLEKGMGLPLFLLPSPSLPPPRLHAVGRQIHDSYQQLPGNVRGCSQPC